ncbi:hypothetical protein BJ508DRAFT_418664 [Ascobolus immersus RN42]|uniref:Uncharacterized protein n=1 Tax=Ascobolus immersus RN42 TaxID=1160509 RepID=A0A3N4HKJ7_ASCIM|nr:hypothetical protein BJ508DRAFT_418664 [Ascobolus immersus RN42]
MDTTCHYSNSLPWHGGFNTHISNYDGTETSLLNLPGGDTGSSCTTTDSWQSFFYLDTAFDGSQLNANETLQFRDPKLHWQPFIDSTPPYVYDTHPTAQKLCSGSSLLPPILGISPIIFNGWESGCDNDLDSYLNHLTNFPGIASSNSSVSSPSTLHSEPSSQTWTPADSPSIPSTPPNKEHPIIAMDLDYVPVIDTIQKSTDLTPPKRRRGRPRHATPATTREYLCTNLECARSIPGNGFKKGRHDNMRNHLRLVHGKVIPKLEPGRKRGLRSQAE